MCICLKAISVSIPLHPGDFYGSPFRLKYATVTSQRDIGRSGGLAGSSFNNSWNTHSGSDDPTAIKEGDGSHTLQLCAYTLENKRPFGEER